MFPTRLAYCVIDNIILADGLRGNTNLKLLNPRFSGDIEVCNRELLAIAGALRENKGIVNLQLDYRSLGLGDAWGAICDSLKTHPTLKVLNLRSAQAGMDAAVASAVIASRIQALVDMVKVNPSIHTIHLVDLYSKHELYRGSVIP